MSKAAKVVMALVVVGGIVVGVLAYVTGRDSTDAQEALVLPFVVLWTGLALVLVWMLDGLGRALWRRFHNRR